MSLIKVRKKQKYILFKKFIGRSTKKGKDVPLKLSNESDASQVSIDSIFQYILVYFRIWHLMLVFLMFIKELTVSF